MPFLKYLCGFLPQGTGEIRWMIQRAASGDCLEIPITQFEGDGFGLKIAGSESMRNFLDLFQQDTEKELFVLHVSGKGLFTRYALGLSVRFY